ncbi:uncharacterized protein Pyn_12735 [Prunus yedoensis var. nudiflora]|uniref:Uncharacterized protein n=1 Tax=Prunus yedoensis var. nudiflora TaxID=2094558 RepID=A0A314XEP3_PRUYE|nr:uncharacterized protein Pyn_12735 [Prunus yedoensis var. nudiflora]
MRRTVLNNVSLYARNSLLSPPTCNPNPSSSLVPLATLTRSLLRLFSSEDDSSAESSNQSVDSTVIPTDKKDASVEVQDINNKGHSNIGKDVDSRTSSGRVGVVIGHD